MISFYFLENGLEYRPVKEEVKWTGFKAQFQDMVRRRSIYPDVQLTIPYHFAYRIDKDDSWKMPV